jgi:hypothetical protein
MLNIAENAEGIVYTLLLILPGFVWTQTEEKFVPRSRIDWSERVLGFVSYTVLNYVFWLQFNLADVATRAAAGSLTPSLFTQLALIAFVSPIVGGVLTGLYRQQDPVGALCNKVGIQTIHRVGTAWEWMAMNAKVGLVRVCLKNGDEVEGWFGRRSMASTDPSQRDIFIEERMTSSDDGSSLEFDPQSTGVWVSSDEIATIYFFRSSRDGQAKRQFRIFGRASVSRSSSKGGHHHPRRKASRKRR